MLVVQIPLRVSEEPFVRKLHHSGVWLHDNEAHGCEFASSCKLPVELTMWDGFLWSRKKQSAAYEKKKKKLRNVNNWGSAACSPSHLVFGPVGMWTICTVCSPQVEADSSEEELSFNNFIVAMLSHFPLSFILNRTLK